MKKNRFFKTVIQICIVAFVAVAVTNAQPINFQPHGNNSSGSTVASENIDSVTVGSTMRYFVMPDSVANPDYDFDAGTGLLSGFDWWTSESETVTPVNPGVENDVEIQWTAVRSDVINVTEIGSCNSLDTTRINVAVIGVPEAGFNHATYTDDICTDDPGEVKYNFPVSLSTDVNSGNIRVHVTVLNTTTSTTIFDGDLDLSETDNQITVGDGENGTFDDYGSITVSITSVSDRISRKSSVAGTLTSGADVFTYTIIKPPTTGTIYHLPNN